MLVIAHHKISDPENFWSAAEEVAKNLPGNLNFHGVYPAMDGKPAPAYGRQITYRMFNNSSTSRRESMHKTSAMK